MLDRAAGALSCRTVLLVLVSVVCLPACTAQPAPPSSAGAGGGASATSTTDDDLVDDIGEAALWLTFDETTVTYDGIRQFEVTDGGTVVARVETTHSRVVLAAGPPGRGRALRLPPICTASRRCRMAMVVVPDAGSFDPGGADFSYGASVKLAPEHTTTGSNIIQKGRYGTPGGQWKLQVDSLSGKPSCVVRGASKLMQVRSSSSIADGEWHRVICAKHDADVEIDVDGITAREVGAAGAIDNDFEVRVGSSGISEDDDQFHGTLDDVFLTIADDVPVSP